MTDTEVRVPVQGEGLYWIHETERRQRGIYAHEPGTVAHSEYLRAWDAYDRKYCNGQSAELIIERGGFSFSELTQLLGHKPETFEPLVQ